MTASGGRHMLQHAAKLCPWVRVGADLPNHPKIHQEEFCPQHHWNPPSVDPWLSSGWCCPHQQHLLSQIFGAFWWVCTYPLSVSTILTLPPDAAILFLPVIRSLTQLPSRENCFALRRVFHFLFRRGFLELLAQLWGNTPMVIFNTCFTPSTFYDSVICLGVWSSCHDQKKM